MDLIASYHNAGFESVADGVMSFFDQRLDLQHSGIAFGNAAADEEPSKVSTDISLVAIDRSDPEAFALSDVIVRGVTAALNKYLEDRPLFRECCPEQSMFVVPVFNIQRYRPGEGFKKWHCDWTISDEATEPVHRVLAWILYCNDIHSGGTEFYWQKHHESAERGKLIIFPAGPSHLHRGQVNDKRTKTIATGWINAGRRDSYLSRLAAH
ncbi:MULTISPECIES: 2OG-Fe(II) oxygenase [unclassified Prochlorococcus]|uniref:2OG-Fe(II) oxygenase n=1 Tax=unclassified Prochlorococcus TaxID=2627481 RepID=UPI00056C5E7F|nr:MULTISPECIES: 2OG-Fe(II) oxygenase [unclassified Prochlorococcus]